MSFVLAAALCRNAAGDILFVWTKAFPPGNPLSIVAEVALLPVQEAHFIFEEGERQVYWMQVFRSH